MKKNIYIFEIILLLFIALYKFFFLKYMGAYADLILVVFFIGSCFVLKSVLGLRKDASLVKKNSIQVVFISIMLFILIGYLSGLYFGFLKNAYSLEITSIIKNIYPIFFMIMGQELIRFMIAKRGVKDNKPLIVLTILFILMDVVFTFNPNIVTNGLKLFIYVTNTFAPSVARHVLCSYLCLHVSYLPGLILRLFFGLYIYVLPIFPDYGYYIGSVVGILIPYIIYICVSKFVQYAEQTRLPAINKGMWYINIPLLAIMIFVVVLVSGIFKYQIIAIGSGSMEPNYYKGDAVVFEKIKLEEHLLITDGTIICYRHGNKYVTHRVVEIIEENGEVFYQTKGDNNDNNDDYLVETEDVIGIVRLRIKGIGWPTIWFQELIS